MMYKSEIKKALLIFLLFALCNFLTGCWKVGPAPAPRAKSDVNSPVPDVQPPIPQPTPNNLYVKILAPVSESTFLSTDTISLQAAVYNGNYTINECSWSIERYEVISEDAGKYTISGVLESRTLTQKGTIADFTQELSPAPAGRGKKILYIISFNLNNQGVNIADSIYIVQDYIDQCRQEYIDMVDRIYEPTRSDFINSRGGTYFTLDELSVNTHYGNRAVYIKSILTSGLDSTRINLGESMIVSSGYRNPIKQYYLNPSAPNSLHQYGQAADIYTKDYNENGRIDEADWGYLREFAKDNGACVEPYRITQTWGYVHMDWGRDSCPSPDW